MDSFKEQIVKKIPSTKDRTLKTLIMVAGIFLAALILLFSFLYLPMVAAFSVFIAAALVYGAFFLAQRFSVEYEYIYTNGEMDVDKIIAQRSRKRLVTVKMDTATAFGVADDNYTVDSDKTLILASSNSADDAEYYIEFSHKSLGASVIIFSPDEDLLELVKSSLPRQLKKEIEKY